MLPSVLRLAEVGMTEKGAKALSAAVANCPSLIWLKCVVFCRVRPETVTPPPDLGALPDVRVCKQTASSATALRTA